MRFVPSFSMQSWQLQAEDEQSSYELEDEFPWPSVSCDSSAPPAIEPWLRIPPDKKSLPFDMVESVVIDLSLE